MLFVSIRRRKPLLSLIILYCRLTNNSMIQMLFQFTLILQILLLQNLFNLLVLASLPQPGDRLYLHLAVLLLLHQDFYLAFPGRPYSPLPRSPIAPRIPAAFPPFSRLERARCAGPRSAPPGTAPSPDCSCSTPSTTPFGSANPLLLTAPLHVYRS